MRPSTPPALSFADQVAAATGLAGLLATGAVERCCLRAGTFPERMGRRELKRLLPALETVLLVYLSSADAEVAIGKLRRLTHPVTSMAPGLRRNP